MITAGDFDFQEIVRRAERDELSQTMRNFFWNYASEDMIKKERRKKRKLNLANGTPLY